MATLRIGVLRDSPEETTLAAIEVKRTDRIQDERTLREAVTRAVTRWINETREGRAAWEWTGHEFTVADLENFLDDETLAERLEEEGVENLTIETASYVETAQDWAFDAVLVYTTDLVEQPAAQASGR